jgi:hypothetical protein
MLQEVTLRQKSQGAAKSGGSFSHRAPATARAAGGRSSFQMKASGRVRPAKMQDRREPRSLTRIMARWALGFRTQDWSES